MNFFLIVLILTASCLGLSFPVQAQASCDHLLLICGDDRVVLLDPDREVLDSTAIVWEWRPTDAGQLPPDYVNSYFRTIDECKLLPGGREIMITSSSGGVAVVDRQSKQASFFARVPNAHSIKSLPGRRLVVAASVNDEGNRIILFDQNTLDAKPLFQDSLFSAHGLVWDAERVLLYALGMDELRAYRLGDWESSNPRLLRVDTWHIPGESGHDLVRNPANPDQLILSETNSTWVFDKNTGRFEAFAPLEGKHEVKGIAVSADETGRLAYTIAEESWWTHHVYLKEPDQVVSLPGIHIYKVRWMC